MIEGHGNDLHKYGNKVIADFSSNVWPDGTNHLVLEHLKSKLEIIRHYPEPNAESLTVGGMKRWEFTEQLPIKVYRP